MIYFQSNGDRAYLNSTLVLTADQIECVKNMNRFMNSPKHDYAFVSKMLTFVFSQSVLSGSSAGGKRSNFNGKGHDALDASKLGFIKG